MIKLEDFKKLKQNDRIEYMLRSNHLDKKQSSTDFDWFSFVLLLSAMVGFTILLSLQMYILEFYDAFISIFNVVMLLSKVMVVVVISGVLWNVIWELCVFKKERKELEEEFFKTETKPSR